MSGIMALSTYGEFGQTYEQLNVYLLLLFFTFSYVMIDSGMQMVNEEIRNYM